MHLWTRENSPVCFEMICKFLARSYTGWSFYKFEIVYWLMAQSSVLRMDIDGRYLVTSMTSLAMTRVAHYQHVLVKVH